MIRQGNIDDLEQILKLYNKNGKSLGRYFKQDVIDSLNDGYWYVKVNDDKIIGFCSYEIKKRLKKIVITDLCVDEKYRKQHIATNLINVIHAKTQDMKLPYYAECLEGLENNAFYYKIATLESIKKHETYNILVFRLFL